MKTLKIFSKAEEPRAVSRTAHYESLAVQPWEVIEQNNMGFFDGNVLKYIMRYKTKNGVEDLLKAKHYLECLIRIESDKFKLN